MDLKPLDLSRDSDSDSAFHSEVRDHCEKYGFVIFTGHGIEDTIIEESFEWARRFFTLTDQAKQRANRPSEPGPNRGYAAVGREKLAGISGYAKGVAVPKLVEDIKESFDLGPDHDARFPTPWPSEADIPGFRDFMQRFRRRCDKVHLRILRTLQTALGLADSRLLSLCNGDKAEVRITHYPAVDWQRLQTGNAFRIAEHTDTGTLTLLFQDSVGGLEIEHQTRPGEFLPVITSRQSEMIVNVGDTLSLFTNGKLRSANHRVVAPTGSDIKADGMVPARFSVAYFGKANSEALMQPLSEFVEGRQDQDAGHALTAADYYSNLQTKTFPVGPVAVA